MLAPDLRRRLTVQLEDARSRGMLGPGPVEAHLDHAEGMAAAVECRLRRPISRSGLGRGRAGLDSARSVAGGDRGLARCTAATMLVPRGGAERARAERSSVGRLRPGRGAGPATGLPGGVRPGGGAGLWISGDDRRMCGGLPPGRGPPGRERAAGRARPDALAGRRARRIGPARAGAAARGGSRGRSPHGGGTGGGAVASAGGRSGATALVVIRRLGPDGRCFP